MINSELEYNEKLKRLESIFEAEPNTPEFDELILLAYQISEYEEKHYPLPEPDEEDIKAYNKEQGRKN